MPPTAHLLPGSTADTACETSSPIPTGPHTPTTTPVMLMYALALDPYDTARAITESNTLAILGRPAVSVNPGGRESFAGGTSAARV